MTSCPPSPPPPFVGSVVELRGLKARPDLNGSKCVVITPFDAETGRCGVQIDGDKEGLNIKPANLLEIPETYVMGLDVVVDSGEGGLGRVAVATRDFKPGETVLAEPPALVFDGSRGYFGLFDAFLRAPDRDREAILDMDAGAGGADMAKQVQMRISMVNDEHKSYVRRNPSAAQTLTVGLALKLMLIVSANAHAFSTVSTGALVTTHAKMPKESTALFAVGSKVEHSCSPNLTYGVKNGKLVYIAESFIKRGDRLSISYMNRIFEAAREERRNFLMENKSLACKCVRCRGRDDCRPLWCECDQSVVFSAGLEERWQCVSCGKNAMAADDAFIGSKLSAEKALLQRIRGYELGLKYGGLDVEMIRQMVELQTDIAEKLHPLHWLHATCYTLMSSLAASGARMLMKDGHPPASQNVKKLIYLSALSLLRHVVWLERNIAIVRGILPLEDAVKSVKFPVPIRKRKPSASASPGARIEDVTRVVDCLYAFPRDAESVSVAHSVFHAGQDLLLAGDCLVVCRLYGRYQGLFGRWISLSDDNRERVQILLRSDGKENKFGNHLMG